MKILVELLFTAVFVSLVLAQDYVEKQDDQYYPSEPSQHRSRYGSSYGRYGGYRHRQGYGYGYKRCPKLDDPENGKVEVSGNHPGSKAIHSCTEGYILTGRRVRVCQRNGVWSGKAPTCEPIDCGPPDEPDVNGDVDFDETTLGNTAVYTCNSGYELPSRKDSETVTCLPSGDWSGPAPSCSPVNCGQPPKPNSNGGVRVGATTFKSTAVYFCNSGYILDTSNGGSQYVYCQASKTWSGIAPACVPIDCGFLDTPVNGVVDFVPDTKLDSDAEYSCRRGFKLVGNDVRHCQANGDWSGSQPTCERIQCPNLKAPKFGKILVSGYYVDDYAIYRCAYGYDLSNKHRRRVCQEDGTWSGSAPDCEKGKYYDHYDDYNYDEYNQDGGNDDKKEY